MNTNTKIGQEAAGHFMKLMVDHGIVKSCINCDNFDSEENKCRIYKSTPPAKVIVYSCGDSWVPYIPF